MNVLKRLIATAREQDADARMTGFVLIALTERDATIRAYADEGDEVAQATVDAVRELLEDDDEVTLQ